MSRRCFFALLSLTLIISLAAVPAAGQSQPAAAENWTPQRTADGVPDISGTFTFRTLTPMQRPQALVGKENLSAEEALAFEASENRRLNRDLFDPIEGAPCAGYPAKRDGGVLSYNEFWYERGVEMVKDKRTSLIVDPPDGRIPFTKDAMARNRIRRGKLVSGFADTWTDRSLSDRCIMGFNSGPPMTPGSYNNNVMILQIPGQVVILNEMVHNARFIPTDGRPHLPVRQWVGSSRGHWEGETLVVETTNFYFQTSLRGSSPDTRLIERFTRIDADTLTYEFTVEDPNNYTRSWTASIPFRRTDGALFEYACHEGNYGLYNILAGARNKEKEAAKKE